MLLLFISSSLLKWRTRLLAKEDLLNCISIKMVKPRDLNIFQHYNENICCIIYHYLTDRKLLIDYSILYLVLYLALSIFVTFLYSLFSWQEIFVPFLNSLIILMCRIFPCFYFPYVSIGIIFWKYVLIQDGTYWNKLCN